MGVAFADWVLALEQSGLGAEMRSSAFLYPSANVLHILGLAAFAAAVAIMDLRLLGTFSTMPLARFVTRWRQIAAVALLVQMASGFLLFAAEASAIAENPVFRLKLLLILVGILNVVVFDVMTRPRLSGWQPGAPPPTAARIAGAVSLAVWLAVAATGRLIAYF
jgi:hypothetical protein